MAEPPSKRRKTDRQAAQVDRDIGGVVAKLDVLLFREISKVVDATKKKRLTEAATELMSIEGRLQAAGLDDVLAGFSPIYADQVENILDDLEAFSGIDREDILEGFNQDELRALARLEIDLVDTRIGEYIARVRPTIARSLLTGEEVDFSRIHETSGQATLNQIHTEMNTALSAFQRTVAFEQGERLGANYYLYSGGLIPTSRPFCSALAGKVYTREQLELADNGQGIPVLSGLGGYNCRHTLIPVDEETARKIGIGEVPSEFRR